MPIHQLSWTLRWLDRQTISPIKQPLTIRKVLSRCTSRKSKPLSSATRVRLPFLLIERKSFSLMMRQSLILRLKLGDLLFRGKTRMHRLSWSCQINLAGSPKKILFSSNRRRLRPRSVLVELCIEIGDVKVMLGTLVQILQPCLLQLESLKSHKSLQKPISVQTGIHSHQPAGSPGIALSELELSIKLTHL